MTLHNIKNKLIGAWTLVKYIDRNTDTPDPSASGTLEYSVDGHVKARIQRIRRNEKTPSQGGYDGTYHLTDTNTVIHTVETSLNPDIVGLKLERNISFPADDHLIIKGKRSGESTNLEIHWKKTKPS